ncbi:hypothetical protein WJR50_23600 [Catalinimonas sp. 4WD22]|uniref:hypothetical protein n=1 Tax=Catalinimonas locisalis TaxID=3133978 RepID=UPI0031015B8A
MQTQMAYACYGLLRRYFINDKGNEITTGLVKENEYAADKASLPYRIRLTSRWMKAISKRESTTFLS